MKKLFYKIYIVTVTLCINYAIVGMDVENLIRFSMNSLGAIKVSDVPAYFVESNKQDLLQLSEQLISVLRLSNQVEKPILLIRNNKNEGNKINISFCDSKHYYSIKHFQDFSNEYTLYSKPQKTQYPSIDHRLEEHSALIIYLFHKKALDMISQDIKVSKKYHIQELEFMFNRKKNKSAPILMLIDKAFMPAQEDQHKLVESFKKGNAKNFVNCLYAAAQTKEKIAQQDESNRIIFGSNKLMIALTCLCALGILKYLYNH